jgi:O-glycosyl hydrolase
MNITRKSFFRSLLSGAILAVAIFSAVPAVAQTEVMAWGNMTGIRIDGLLIDFESSVRVVEPNWKDMDYTGRERQRPRYTRDGEKQTVKSKIQYIAFDQTVEDKGKGTVGVSLAFSSDSSARQEGVYYCFDLPDKHYATAKVSIGGKNIAIAPGKDISAPASGKIISIVNEERNIRLSFASSVNAFIRKEGKSTVLYIRIFGDKVSKGQKTSVNFVISSSGKIDNSPALITVDKNNPGRLFAGFGGNFRLQNPQNDPKVIDYCLDNMRVAFGRVEMPWMTWQPTEDSDPLKDALDGKINARVESAAKMAQRLAAKGMPVIISAWFPPSWALPGGKMPRMMGGVAGWKLDSSKSQKIYKSLADYLVFIKKVYGVEAYAFSFNESDIGINVLHSPEEHAIFIKEFGAYLASRGLATKLLLGDNSDATTYDFIVPALNDPATHKYIAAVSFHSWRGCDDETLHRWAGASKQLNVPILVGEGSTDAAAHTYPQIFAEPTFALYEINLYTRIAAICQPISILQWQLTSDYSILWGDGIYGSTGALRPTQRYWNLKQLSDTPANAFSLAFTCDKEEVSCAAFGNMSTSEYAVHLVNNAGARPAVIKGIPALAQLKAYATNISMSMKEIQATRNADGSISVELPPAGFVSVFVK